MSRESLVSKKKIKELSNDENIFYYLLQNNLSAYIQKVFNTLNPSTNYLHNWHIDAIADYLQAVQDKEICKLIINMPPRFMKSIAVSVAWTTYLLGHKPSTQIICASFASTLAENLSVQSRNVMTSGWYKKVFGTKIAEGENKKMWFTTTERGHRYATSVGATVTGFGGDFLILDDPLNPEEASSDTMRRRCNQWISETFLTRANNPKDHALVLVMQRLHEDDPSGLLFGMKDDLGDFEHLILPAEFEKKTVIITPKHTFIKEENELLHPERFGEKEVKEKRMLMGAYAYAGQYLQRPSPIGGGIIKRHWFKPFEIRPFKFDHLIHSWDTAIKANAGSDYSVCTVWGVNGDGYYLLDVWRGQVEYPELKQKCLFLTQRDKPDYILIEDKASGQSLIQDLRASSRMAIYPIMPHRDKVTRASSITPLIESGNVFIDQSAYWVSGFLNECDMFPNGKNDDMVDSMSQFLNWAKSNNRLKIKEENVIFNNIVKVQSAWAV